MFAGAFVLRYESRGADAALTPIGLYIEAGFTPVPGQAGHLSCLFITMSLVASECAVG